MSSPLSLLLLLPPLPRPPCSDNHHHDYNFPVTVSILFNVIHSIIAFPSIPIRNAICELKGVYGPLWRQGPPACTLPKGDAVYGPLWHLWRQGPPSILQKPLSASLIPK